MKKFIRRIPLIALVFVAAFPAVAQEDDATAIVKAAIDHWRGLSSDGVMTMVIHRPDWERTMTMRAWTKGDDRSLVRVLVGGLGADGLDGALLVR